MMGPIGVILLMYDSHDMRHTGFRRLTVVNGTPEKWGVIEKLYRDTEILCRDNQEQQEGNFAATKFLCCDIPFEFKL